MEVPRRPQPSSLKLPLPKAASPALPMVTKNEPMRELPQEKRDGPSEDHRTEEDTLSTDEESGVSELTEAPDEASELEQTNISTGEACLNDSSQDSFSEEKLAEEAVEAKKKSEEEEAAAKERAAQRQVLSIEELVQSERNYLRLLQVSTVTIRTNLHKLQVHDERESPALTCMLSDCGRKPRCV